MKSTKAGDVFLGSRMNGGKIHNTVTSELDPIGQRLRDFFSIIEDEGIPDRFLDLLEKLDAAENAAGKLPDNPNGYGAKNGI